MIDPHVVASLAVQLASHNYYTAQHPLHSTDSKYTARLELNLWKQLDYPLLVGTQAADQACGSILYLDHNPLCGSFPFPPLVTSRSGGLRQLIHVRCLHVVREFS